eukprot:762266_1
MINLNDVNVDRVSGVDVDSLKKPLTKDDMIAILTQTQYNLIQQQVEMLKTENCELILTQEAIDSIAETAVKCNENVENIGARWSPSSRRLCKTLMLRRRILRRRTKQRHITLTN